MNDFIIYVLDSASYIAVLLIILIGSLTTLIVLLWPVWYLFNFLYKRTEGVTYFVSFVRHRKKFIKWYKDTGPNFRLSSVRKEED
ncbi:hypothetical protein ACM26V_00020 [Salipaludibacillus sp. HK11]|uniref:hypothetical protein n=1 Tax=Salipaludibacillus sp. HK11 TaxID=3394320 RepID=UPI0039FC764F